MPVQEVHSPVLRLSPALDVLQRLLVGARTAVRPLGQRFREAALQLLQLQSGTCTRISVNRRTQPIA